MNQRHFLPRLIDTGWVIATSKSFELINTVKEDFNTKTI